MRMLILSTFERCTLTTELKRRIQAIEMRCFRRPLNISYKNHMTNEEVRNRIQNATGVHDDLLSMAKKRKLRWYGHISRSSGMAKTILQGTVKEREEDRRRNRKITFKNWQEWSLENPWEQQKTVKDGKVFLVPRRPSKLRDWKELRWVTVINVQNRPNDEYTTWY